MSAPEPELVLRYAGLGARIEQFFSRLSERPDLRDQFLNDPVGVVSREVLEVPDAQPGELARASRFTLALLSNPSFMTWLEDWAARHVTAFRTGADQEDPAAAVVEVDRYAILDELVEGIWQHADREALLALLPSPSEASEREEEIREDVLGAGVSARGVRFPRPPRPVNTVLNVNVAVNVSVGVGVGLVFVVIVIVVAAPLAPLVPETVTRDELMSAATELGRSLEARANEIRQQGAFTKNPRDGRT